MPHWLVEAVPSLYMPCHFAVPLWLEVGVKHISLFSFLIVCFVISLEIQCIVLLFDTMVYDAHIFVWEFSTLFLAVSWALLAMQHCVFCYYMITSWALFRCQVVPCQYVVYHCIICALACIDRGLGRAFVMPFMLLLKTGKSWICERQGPVVIKHYIILYYILWGRYLSTIKRWTFGIS